MTEVCKHGLEKLPDYVCKRCVKDSLNRLQGGLEYALVREFKIPTSGESSP